jgi:hypothetical protein
MASNFASEALPLGGIRGALAAQRPQFAARAVPVAADPVLIAASLRSA